ncbi:MAG: hypothetical protein GW936_07420 [Gallionella sp.]|nr:hypothetical protein [Gallionella sp.]
MKNISRLALWVISCLIILFGLFVFVSTRDIPLPNNAKREGGMIHIDVSEEAINETEKNEALFVVPEKFTPEVFERGFAFNFKFPDGTPYTGNESPVPLDRVRVVVKHHAKIEAARSSYVLRHTQPKGGTLFATPWFVESKDGVEMYQYKINATAIGTYFKFVATDGSNILADDAGDWARAYEINRKLSPHIELNYLLSKKLVRDSKHFIEDVTAVDNAVLKLAKSFQSK